MDYEGEWKDANGNRVHSFGCLCPKCTIPKTPAKAKKIEYKIHVTQSDINAAKADRRNDPAYRVSCQCPIARALARVVPGFEGAGYDTFEVRGREIPLPKIAGFFTRDFDDRRPVRPIIFTVEV